MKKKNFMLVSFLSALVASVGLGVACKEKDPETPQADPTRVVIADFETWETGLQLIRTHANFGKITWNKDAAYASEGNGSAKLQPLGGYDSGTMAQFFYPTYSELFDINNKDFSAAKNVTFDFYNAEERELKVAVGLVTTILGPTSWKNSTVEYQTLPAKEWTTISYEVNTSLLSMSCDVEEIQGIYVAFENQGSRELADAPIVYLDNIVLNKYETAPEMVNPVQLGENELMDFEHPEWQNYVVSTKDTADAPTISIVKAEDEELLKGTGLENHVSGKNVLKIVSPVTSAGVWPGVQFAAALLQESLFNGLAENMYGATTFKFDLYNASNAELGVNVRFQDAEEDYAISFVPKFPAKAWTTAEYNIKEMYEDYRAKNKKMNLFTNPGMVDMRWGVKQETTFYIDNLRFEQEDVDQTVKPTVKVAPFAREVQVGTSISLPSVEVIDTYDLSPSATIKAYYENGTAWEEVSLNNGKVPVEKAGRYKLQITGTNKMKNSTVVDCYFEGKETASETVLAQYTYEDETDTIKIGTRTDTNTVTHLEEVTLGGETRQGVMKVETDNFDKSYNGTGFIGFAFADDYVKRASEKVWKSITIRMYVQTEANVASVDLSSYQTNLTPGGLATGKWVDFTITRNALNVGTPKSYINQSGAPMTIEKFNAKAEEVFGMYNSTYFFYVGTSVAPALKKQSKITYYIDEITFDYDDYVGIFDNDDATDDIYQDEWVDPNIRGKENE